MFPNPLVVAFIMAADKDQMLLLSQLFSNPLIIRLPLRTHQNDPWLHGYSFRIYPRIAVLSLPAPCILQHMLYRCKNRIRLQHHPAAAAVGCIIHSVMLVA
ncbi:hypothetical protein D3C73_1154080 [compost metagenome]